MLDRVTIDSGFEVLAGTLQAPGDCVNHDAGTRAGTVSRYLPPAAPRSIVRVARAVDRFLRHDMSTYAAALAYRGLFALFPFLIFVIAIVNALDMGRPFEALAEWSRSEGSGRLPSAIRQWLVVQARVRADGAAVIVAAGAAVWAVATGARVLRRALDTAAESSTAVPAWRRLAWSLIAAPALAGAMVIAILLFTVTRRMLSGTVWTLGMNDSVTALWNWLRFPAGMLLAGVAFSVVYRFAPSDRPRFRSIMPGAAVAAALWIAASLAFAFSVAGVLRFGGTYGSFTAALVLLVYLYLAAAGVLFGAEWNAVLTADSHRVDRGDSS